MGAAAFWRLVVAFSVSLLVLLTAVPAAGSVVMGPGSPGARPRQVEVHRSATYNMHYRAERWQHGVFPLTVQAEILTLQEVPDGDPPDAEPAAGRLVGAQTTMPNGYTVERYRWVNCRPPDPQSPCIIYRLKTPRRNRSIAVVVNQAGDNVVAVNVIAPQSTQPDAKPALGIELSDGTWFYSVHARNRANRVHQANDAPDLVREIARVAGDHWAASGDFNRTPDSWGHQLPPGLSLVRSGLATYPVGAPTDELDYMVVKGLSAPWRYTAYRLTYVDGSDHYPVGFWYSLVPGGNEYRCDPGDAQLRARQDECAREAATVAMGDSYISGEAGRWAGNANTSPEGTVWGTDRAATDCTSESNCDHDLDRVYGLTSYAEGGNRCDRSDTAPIITASYPEVASWRHFDLACSGATTNEITQPFTEKDEPAQTEQLKAVASAYRVKEIVVSIGGNDLGFEDIVRSCAKRFLLGFVAYCKNAWGDQSTELDTVGNKVTQSLRDIQNTMRQAGYGPGDYRLVVQDYPQPLPPGDAYRYPETYERYSQGGCPFYDTDTDWARDTLVTGMARELGQAAKTVGAAFLDVRGALAHHELCHEDTLHATSLNNPLDPQSAEWVRWISYLYFPHAFWASQGNQQESIHPNAFGQRALGNCLTQLGDQPPPGVNSQFRCTNDGLHGTDGMQIKEVG
ncbi:endonuclease/exonuclease/phosphatase family protein [Streptomyces sp. NPDC052101]|uniref:endonuclease/exonuclease/phosphatase family protein n=1 Tax=Streptomyces sp. NPDC052101 TaxID=3155763 RepID=UPI003420E0DC